MIMKTCLIFFVLFSILLAKALCFIRQSANKSEISVILTNSSLNHPNNSNSTMPVYEYAYGSCIPNRNCFLPYGICINSMTCMCMPDFANIFVQGHSIETVNCSYKKKKVIIAGSLEMFLPFGLGHLYAGHTTIALVKFCYNWIIYSFFCVLFYKGHENPHMTNLLVLCLVLTCIIPLWNIIDMFLFFSGNYQDGYGVPMI